MFISKIHSRNFTQLEHARLAGQLAQIWGNENFSLPNIPHNSFVLGVTFHDRAYETYDTSPIGEVDEEQWLALQLKGFNQKYKDRIANIIVQMHLKRLLAYSQKPSRDSIIAQMEVEIEKNIKQTEFSRSDFEYADSITAFCDKVAFDVCMESPLKSSAKVFNDLNTKYETEIYYELKQNGILQVNPWPFCLEKLQIFLIAYEKNCYPQKLEPEIVKLEIYPEK